MILRIVTEDKNSAFVEELVARYFPSFLFFRGVEYGKGTKDSILTIEISLSPLDVSIDESAVKGEQLAQAIKKLNKQETILMQLINSHNVVL